MTRLFKQFLITITLWLAAASCPAREIQILIPSADSSTTAIDKMEPVDRLGRCICLHLLERLPEVPGVAVVDEPWARDLLFEQRCRHGKEDSQNLLADLGQWLPVDATISYRLADNDFVLSLYTAGGVKTRHFPGANRATTASVVYAAAEFLADGLSLGQDARRALTEKRVPDAALDAVYLSRRLGTPWIYNSGEARLKVLRPFAADAPRYPRLAAAIVDAGVQWASDGRKADSPRHCLDMVRAALPVVLGTRYEPQGYDFLRLNRFSPKDVEGDLWALVEPLTLAQDRLEDLLDAKAPAKPSRLGVALNDPARFRTPVQQAGAIRSLGVARSERLWAALRRLARLSDAAIRQAVCFAAGQYDIEKSEPLLKTLLADKDPTVAFAASYQLWRLGRIAGDDVVSLARAAGQQPAMVRQAAEVLGAHGTASDVAILSQWAAEGDIAVRAAALGGLARLKRLPDEALLTALRSGSGAIVTAVLGHLPDVLGEDLRRQVNLLASHRHPPVAEAARRNLARFRPHEARLQTQFDLQTENLYVRLALVEKLAAAKETWAIDVLAEATRNPDPQVRAEALVRLAGRDPQRTRQALTGALSDPYRWVRIHAAAVAARVAGPELAPACRKQLEVETDRVARTYLADALALAQGQPPPASPPPVDTFDPKKTTFGNCGFGEKAASSPFGYYYLLDTQATPAAKAAMGGNRVVLARANSTAHNPVQVLFHPIWRDQWWMGLETDLADVSWLDGVVLGEESMYTSPWQLWDDHWRVFCRDAAIEPDRIDGHRQRLSSCQQLAYLDWEEERAVDGLNRMYDFIKLYYGKLRPGFLVGTFMPDQNGPFAGDRRWKFDVGGAYYYGTNNRERFSRIRRLKTLWPDRPVMWLVSGTVSTVPEQSVKYNTRVLTEPLSPPCFRAYSHSVAAWLAGADPGLFAVWLFTLPGAKGISPAGSWLALEDIGPGSATLRRAVEYSFGGVEAAYRLQSQTQGQPQQPGQSEPAPSSDMVNELLKDAGHAAGKGKADAVQQRVEAEKRRLETGFLLEQKHLYDLARVFAGLPRPTERPDVLFVAPLNAVVAETVPAYDILARINQLADLELNRYRLIGIVGCETAPLQERTIAAVTRWLRDVPGLLYVRGTVSMDRNLKAGTADDHEGPLQTIWPWADDVGFQKDRYTIKSPAVSRLDGPAGPTRTVLWKKPEFKGIVLLDTAPGEPRDMRRRMEEVCSRHNVGPQFSGTAGVQNGRVGGVTGAAVASKVQEVTALAGMDLLTGRGNPQVGPGLAAGVVAEDYTGTYVANLNGVRVLCERPIRSVQASAGGLKLNCEGLLQATALGGTVTVRPADGATLKKIEGPEAVLRWLLASEEPGMAVLPIPDSPQTVTFVRHRGELEILCRK